MEYERSIIFAASPADLPKAQSTFLAAVVANFTPESFNVLRRYLLAKGDTKGLTALLLKALRAADAGNEVAQRGLCEEDMREKQGILGVRSAEVFMACV